ncbi:hypothetical protein MVEN_00873100 [Mycena venus]|uniref:HNH nuclease domain-containing protein n=1 Tax=Mycena venus TaxID=2733690 RepID=A0A8H7D3P2_9AGAR|nr:hypothetical protein MVEN_00873100 [Mycena venus]
MSYPQIPPLDQSWPLPPANEIGLDTSGVSAWHILLSAESAALALPKASAMYQDKVVAVRLIGWFIKDLWEHSRSAGYTRLCKEVFSCNNVSASTGDAEKVKLCHEKVFTMGLDLRSQLLRVFSARTDRTPTPSGHASRPSYEKHRARILEDMANVKPGEGRTRSQAKADALLRDGYKCVMTGFYDKDTLRAVPELEAKANAEGANKIGTQVAHLFSATAQSHAEYAASALSILEMFGLETVVHNLLGKRVNNLFNVMTMCINFHPDFDKFLFWLEAVPGQEHTYDVVARDPQDFFSQTPTPPRRVKFRVDPDAAQDAARLKIPIRLDLPDPELIAIRAACARVAAMSGAADQFLQLYKDHDEEGLGTLSDSESAVYLLDSLLHAVSAQG